MAMKTCVNFILASICWAAFIAPCPVAAGILFRDNFTVSAESENINLDYNVGGRQTGSSAPILYTKAGFSSWSQVGNGGSPGSLLLAGGLGTIGMVSPNLNFNASAGPGGFHTIRLSVDPVSAGSSVSTPQGSWTGIAFGKDTQNSFVNTATGFGILFRGNGDYQVFDGASPVGSGNYASRTAGTFVPIEVRIIDSADGNAFNGSGTGVTIQAYANDVLFFSYSRPGNFTNNYITLIGESDDTNPAVHYVDDFEVGTALQAVVNNASPTNLSLTTAMVNGTVNPNGLATTAEFEYGTSTSYGSVATVSLSPNNGSSTQLVSATLTGLSPSTTYHYRLTATNSNGTVSTTNSTFTTLGAGSLDPSFSSDGIQTTPIGSGADLPEAVVVQADGKIVVAGRSYNGSNNDFALVRYLADGTPDTSFDGDGKVVTPVGSSNDIATAVAVQSDGSIVAAGYSSNGANNDFALVRYLADGSPDSSFGTGGKVTLGFNLGGSNHDVISAIAIQPDGKIVCAGYSNSSSGFHQVVIARLHGLPATGTPGQLDTAFGSGGKIIFSVGSAWSYATSVALQSDGKIVVAGTAGNGTAFDFMLARVHGLIATGTPGNLDNSFDGDGKMTASIAAGVDEAQGIVIQPDGKIVAAGISSNGSNNDIALLRCLTDGAPDPTFGTNGKVSTSVQVEDVCYDIALQTDGRIVVCGSSSNTTADMLAMRYNPDGTLDTTFDGDGKVLLPVSAGADDVAAALAIQPDGGIVLAGHATVGGQADFAVVRLLSGPRDLLVNGGFESNEALGGGQATGFGDWKRDQASTVSTENGITPYAGSRMLKFLGTSDVGASSATDSDVAQYVDLSAYASAISLGNVSVEVKTRFNRVAGTASTDTAFGTFLIARHGTVQSGGGLADNTVMLTSDSDTSTWQEVTNTLTLPAGTTNLFVNLIASENVVNNTTGTEFDGHYADDVRLTINVAPFAPTFTSASSVGVTATAPVLTGLSIGTITLDYAPTPGTSLMLIKNTALPFITSQFSNLAQGQTVTLSYGGVSYNFVANYYGGTGNDLVLQWRGMAARTWGGQSFYPQDHVPPFTKIAAGANHTVALRSDGTVVAWGDNGPGQTTVPSGLSGVAAIAAGGAHTVALKSDSTVVAWGYNGDDQTMVPSGLSGVMAIAAGGAHTVALKSDGTVVAWGRNTEGQTTVPSGLSGVMAIATGDYHTVALKSDGTVVVWGSNGYGQRTVPTGLSGVAAIAAGGAHTVALKSDGTVVAWGRNDNGQRTVPAGLIEVSAIAAGGSHTLVLKRDGSVVAWGRNYEGQTTIPTGLSGLALIAAGGTHTVALKNDGSVAAWGGSGSGQATVPSGLNGMAAIEAGDFHTTALKSDGSVVAWGFNSDGQATVPSGLDRVAAIAAGYTHTVALKEDGTVVAWGMNSFGQTAVPAGLGGVVAIAARNVHTVALKGDGKVVAWGQIYNGSDYVTEIVPNGLSGVVAIAAGSQHTVALKSDGTVVAWGYNDYGQTTVPVGLSGVVAIAAGGYHTVALKSDGTVVAWGYNAYDQTTVPGGLSGVAAIATGLHHTVALKNDGTVVGWGWNAIGQVAVPSGLSGVVAIAAGDYHNAAHIPLKPWVQPAAASSITAIGATVQALTNPNGQPTTFTLQYGPTTSYGSTATFTLPVADSLDWQSASLNLTGLTPGTTYHYRLVSQSSVGTTTGQDQTFTTLPDTMAPVGGTMVISPASPVAAATVLTVFFTNWTDDFSTPLTYAVLVDDVVVSAQGSSHTRNLTAPTTPGTYTLKGRIYDALNNMTEVTQGFTVNTPQESWRVLYFGTTSNSGSAADSFDFDGDGLVNLMEWATGLSPTDDNASPTSVTKTAATFDFFYPRAVTAVNAGAQFIVEWSDTLAANDWHVDGVTEEEVANNGTVQQMKAVVPVGSLGRRFARLRVVAPTP